MRRVDWWGQVGGHRLGQTEGWGCCGLNPGGRGRESIWREHTEREVQEVQDVVTVCRGQTRGWDELGTRVDGGIHSPRQETEGRTGDLR